MELTKPGWTEAKLLDRNTFLRSFALLSGTNSLLMERQGIRGRIA